MPNQIYNITVTFNLKNESYSKIDKASIYNCIRNIVKEQFENLYVHGDVYHSFNEGLLLNLADTNIQINVENAKCAQN